MAPDSAALLTVWLASIVIAIAVTLKRGRPWLAVGFAGLMMAAPVVTLVAVVTLIGFDPAQNNMGTAAFAAVATIGVAVLTSVACMIASFFIKKRTAL